MQYYYVFAYSSRAESMRFYEILRRNGVPSAVVNTPREITLGCGLSVKVSPQFFSAAKRLFEAYPMQTFLGAYELSPNGREYKTRRVID